MPTRLLRVPCAAALLALACDSGPAAKPPPPPSVEAAPIAGMYEVKGTTVTLESGHTREIAGTVILADEGGHYTATFNLTTTYPGADQAMPAEVIGKGEGTIDGRTLMGSAHTQVVMATVPGVDPGFAFVPRMVSTRIESKTITQIASDGSVSIEIENTPAPGESYAPTRTTLRGTRVSAGGIARGVAKATAPN